MGDRVPRTLPEVYTREAIHLHEEPQRALKLQAIRIGELGIAAIPNEVFAMTGLKIKASSPLLTTMNIELANGSEGYIPPPEQHVLGGYTTWPARTAALEVQAEPKIVATVLSLLEQVAGRSRRTLAPGLPAYAEHVLASRPLAYWRLEEMDGLTAHDATGRENHGRYENGVAFFLPGADLPGLMTDKRINRAPHLAGGRLAANMQIPAESYSIEFWFWNGLPNDARPVTGYLFGRASNRQGGEYLGLNGSLGLVPPGYLFVSQGLGDKVLAGKSEISPRTWHHVVLTRDGQRIVVHLDGNDRPEIASDVAAGQGSGLATTFLGGRHDQEATFEGKIDEIAVYDRPLSAAEIAEHYRAARDQSDSPARR